MKPDEYAKALYELAGKKEQFAVATIVKVEGSSLGKPGFKVIIARDGSIAYGTLGGVCPESAIVTMALQTIRTGQPKTVRVYLQSVEKAVEATITSQSEDEIYVETNCGGMMEVYIEPYLPPERIILIGQGGKDDVMDALVRLGRMLHFETVVVDHAPVLSEKPDLLIDQPNYDISEFPFQRTDSIVVLTKGARDVAVLEAISKTNARFVGLLASRQRVKEDVDALRGIGVSEEFTSSLHIPVGVDIGAITPMEIALSIMTDIVGTKHGKHLPHKSVSLASAEDPTMQRTR